MITTQFFIIVNLIFILSIDCALISPKLITRLVGGIMNSPLYIPIVSQARKTMISTAQSVGIEWVKNAENLKKKRNWETVVESLITEKKTDIKTPDYYNVKFHGYSEGNLCIDAAIEQEIAGKAVGARNFPLDGIKGEETLRSSYETSINKLGGNFIPQDNAIVVDLGCGTGTSTRRLAKFFPHAAKIIGIDLSPHMVSVGDYLNQGQLESAEWVEEIKVDDRIELQLGDVAKTAFASSSVDFVNICLMLHELPLFATRDILQEAYRILKPGGVLAIMEMDPSAPGYIKLRANPFLFSILRSTEPYLDEYFDKVAPNLQDILLENFSVVRTTAATGRHFAIVAIKGGKQDYRPNDVDREIEN